VPYLPPDQSQFGRYAPLSLSGSTPGTPPPRPATSKPRNPFIDRLSIKKHEVAPVDVFRQLFQRDMVIDQVTGMCRSLVEKQK